MSKEIDLSQPLSDADRQYLVDRCRWNDLEENARLTGGEAEVPTADPTNPAVSRTDTVPDAQPAAQGAQNADGAPVQPGSQDDGSQADAGQQDGEHTTPQNNGNDDTDGDGDNYDDPTAWTFDDLRKEAKERELSGGGTREEIVARLREDDAKSD